MTKPVRLDLLRLCETGHAENPGSQTGRESTMKRFFLSALIGVAAVAAIFYISPASTAAPTPEDYPLVCRGGGGLVVGIAPGERNIGFIFVHGTKPAGEGLAPGECSWVDRGMYPNEPDSLSQHVEEGSESLKVGGTLAAENRWYEELHSADNYWTFMVSNNGRGQLIATSARPNKAKYVSTTARVPSAIGQILKRDVPQARALNDETPKVIVLNRPAELRSRMEVMKGLPDGPGKGVPPAPGVLNREEKVELLKSTGLKTFDETPESYVLLTPQQPHVVGRGTLSFLAPVEVDSGINDNIAEFRLKADFTGWLSVRLSFETKGLYLLTFTVYSTSYDRFIVTDPDGRFTTQIFPDKKPKDWQHLNMIVEVPGAGNYYFRLEHEAKPGNLWYFSSCDVTAWKK